MPQTIDTLRKLGQSPWLDFIRRAFIQSGELQRYIDDGWLTGLTSNPTIFKNAISGSTDYDEALEQISRSGMSDPYEAFVTLAVDDIQAAADAFLPQYEATHAADGFVSHEAPPGIERDLDALVAEAHRLFESFERPNVMIKVPGTEVGVRALEQLIADGINVNVTLLFSVDRYVQVAEAYLRGLERRLGAGKPIDRVGSVASFFVSRIDTKVDGMLPANSPLRGTAGIASARSAYRRFHEIFAGRRWERLAAAGARVQRPLWASTSTKNPAYPDVMYIDGLVAPDTVNTMPEKTLRAFADHGSAKVAITPATMAEADQHLRALGAAGVNMRHVTDELLEEGLQSFANDFHALLNCIGEALRAGANRWLQAGGRLGPLEEPVLARVRELGRQEVVRRVWAADHTVWSDSPDEITNRLGWLEIDDGMSEEVDRLEAFAHSVHREGYRNVVLLGMGGSSLAPAVMGATFGRSRRAMSLKVLSTTDPGAIRAAESRIQPKQTLFVVSSKSGGTIETRTLFEYFWSRIPDGRHFVAITDKGTSLEALGRERGFRKVFAHSSDGGPLTGGANIGGRYSALSYFGLVPAALSGVPVGELLERAHEVHQACHACVPMADNPGAWLGAVLGEAALAGRDKLTLALDPRLAALGLWIEQLIAESTGKSGKGILPVVGEPLGPPHVYGADRLFVAIGEPDGHALGDLEGNDQPVVRIPFRDRQQLGAEFFRWEFATAIAGHIIGIHPFNQPNVQEAKDTTAAILDGKVARPDAKTPSMQQVLDTVQPGDYIAILAYARQTPLLDEKLQAMRIALRDRYRVATTVGYGPSYLHSTGQLHKGGPATGVYLIYAPEDRADLDIPGRPYSFGDLKQAQALGDLESLRQHQRRVSWIAKKDIEALAK